jgi:hypothetical protein
MFSFEGTKDIELQKCTILSVRLSMNFGMIFDIILTFEKENIMSFTH